MFLHLISGFDPEYKQMPVSVSLLLSECDFSGSVLFKQLQLSHRLWAV
jgi:hypothetical protein